MVQSAGPGGHEERHMNGRGNAAVRRVVIGVALVCTGMSVSAQIAVSSNDNKAVLVDGVNTVPPRPRPDTVTVLDLGGPVPRVLGELEAPGGWSAPPQSVAVAPDESIALVASSAKVDPANPARTVINDVLSVIDLKIGRAHV